MRRVSPSRILFTGQSPNLGSIKLKLQLYGLGQAKQAPAVREWGWGCGAPVDVAIRSLELSVGKTRVEVPRDAYRNLLNFIPVSVTFREEGDRLFLYMSGGDGAESYETRVEIVRNRVTQRETVGSGFEHPEWPYERIVFNPDGTSSYSLQRSIPRNLRRPSGSEIKLTIEESA
jgi:hypothetical protein